MKKCKKNRYVAAEAVSVLSVVVGRVVVAAVTLAVVAPFHFSQFSNEAIA